MKLVNHTGLLIRLSEFESQCPYHIKTHFSERQSLAVQSRSSVFLYGDVAQWVRAGASYAQGRGFNFLHHYQAMNEDIRAVLNAHGLPFLTV